MSLFINFRRTFGILPLSITYFMNGGINHSDNPTSFTENSPTIILQDPTKEGYVFDG